MLTEAWNPERPDNDEYIDFLNVCFGGSWNAELYRWYLAREFAGRNPDRLVLYRDDVPVAGSTVNYRRLSLPGGAVVDIGIASGSWTVPSERGQGLFSRMMLMSAERAGVSGCRLFLAFVTADNSSSNALARCGAVMREAAYIVADDAPREPDAGKSLPVADANISDQSLFASRDKSRAHIVFHYENAADWSAQFVARPHPIDTLTVGANIAIVENTGDTDRLQWTSAPAKERPLVAATLARRAAWAGRNFFMYGSGAWTADCLASAGLRLIPGYIAVLPAAGTRLREHPEIENAEWDIHSGDRM